MLDIMELKKRYLNLAKEYGINSQEIENIENILEVTLPDDFKQISRFFSGGCLGVVDHYSFNQGNWNNIIDETKRLRATVNLSQNFIVLAEPPESIIVMNLENKPSIIWCNSTDIYNLDTKSYTSNPTVWRDYSDFFSTLLSDEEDE